MSSFHGAPRTSCHLNSPPSEGNRARRSSTGGEAHSLTDLGVLLRHLGRYPESLDHQQRALHLARETGDKNLELEALNGLAETTRAAGSPAEATDLHQRALTLAQEARAWLGLGYRMEALDHSADALTNWREAHDLYTALGVPEAVSTRNKLALNQH